MVRSSLSTCLSVAADQALTVLMRPKGAQSLEDLLSSSTEEGMIARVGQWHRLSSIGSGSSPVWTELDVKGVASLVEPLRAFKGMDCCRWLTDEDEGDQSSTSTAGKEFSRRDDHGLVLVDAAGGEVSILQQSWTEMMAAKIGSPGVAVKPSKEL